MNADIPVTLVWGDEDSVIKESLITDIYDKLPSKHKQWIKVKSYDSLKADHFFTLSQSYFFGGHDGISALHYYASWKWLVAAVWDVQKENGDMKNPYLYGDEAASTGDANLKHTITRNFSDILVPNATP